MCASHRSESSFKTRDWQITSRKKVLISVNIFRLKKAPKIPCRAATSLRETRKSAVSGPTEYLNQVETLMIIPAQNTARAATSAML
jgi:hypothetical protein